VVRPNPQLAAVTAAERRASGVEDLDALVREGQAQIAAKARSAGLAGDPLGYLLEAFAGTLAIFPEHARRIEAAAARTEAAAGRAGQVDPAALQRLERAAAQGADHRAAELARTHSLRTALLAGLVGLGLLATGAAGGWWYGREQTATEALAIQQEIHRTSDTIAAAALKAGPARAALWRDLIDWNADIRQALAYRRDCASNDGRTGCLVPLWVAPPPSDPPPARHATSH
jgi:hypothetical protein